MFHVSAADLVMVPRQDTVISIITYRSSIPRLRAYLERADHDGPLVPAAAAQWQAPRRQPRHGPRCDRPRGAQVRDQTRARSRLSRPLDARQFHHHGARKRRPSSKTCKKPPAIVTGTTKLYNQQGYNPQKAASFFATY